MDGNTIILGAGMTGLAAGFASGWPVFEATDDPGGICSSYYIRPGEKERSVEQTSDGEAYRFEIGGGHWIFGGDAAVLAFIDKLSPVKDYSRRSSVYLSDMKLFVPYPLQNNLRFFKKEIIEGALAEMADQQGSYHTMKTWLRKNFGPTLCNLFFYPFNALYTAGLYDQVAPQDAYKSPVNLGLAIQGTSKNTEPVGYNATFVYPEEGLNVLAQRLANYCDVQYAKRVVRIDAHTRSLYFDDGTRASFDTLISTLPLNKVMEMTQIDVGIEPDPYTSVLVLNIGAVRENRCPSDHWLYIPDSVCGFHRVGFYSNVDTSFLPASSREPNDKVSIYVEKAYLPTNKPSDNDIARYAQSTIRELQDWQFIRDAEVADPTWVDVAYTWSWPGSDWKQKALGALQECGIYQVGRYGRWIFQGIADSIRDGLLVGSALKARNHNI
jgi:protoporphyrinogen oxidase